MDRLEDFRASSLPLDDFFASIIAVLLRLHYAHPPGSQLEIKLVSFERVLVMQKLVKYHSQAIYIAGS